MDSKSEVKTLLKSLLDISDEDETKLLMELIADITKAKETCENLTITLTVRMGKVTGFDKLFKVRPINSR